LFGKIDRRPARGISLTQARGDETGQWTVAYFVRTDHAMRESRMQWQGRATSAVLGEPEVVVDDPEVEQEPLRLSQRLWGRGVEEVQM
jgi:hypothetical protein